MRLLAFCVTLAAACGGSRRAEPLGPPDDDLDLEGSFGRRAEQVEAAPEVEVSPPPGDAGVAALDLVVVEKAAKDGPRIDLSVKDADVTDVLRMIATAAGINLVVADDVKATVTLEVRRVTWRQAIDVIAHLEGLDVFEQRGVVTVTKAGATRPREP
jgi:type II secretory pathway component HofQ